MNFRGINLIFNSQGLKSESSSVISSNSEASSKKNQLQRHPTHHMGEKIMPKF